MLYNGYQDNLKVFLKNQLKKELKEIGKLLMKIKMEAMHGLDLLRQLQPFQEIEVRRRIY